MELRQACVYVPKTPPGQQDTTQASAGSLQLASRMLLCDTDMPHPGTGEHTHTHTLQYSTILPVCLSLTMMLMRLRVELNSSRLSTSYSQSWEPSGMRSRSVMVVLVRLIMKKPNTLAATTRAASSGDSAS